MNPYAMMIPQLLAGLAIVVVALRAIRQSRKESEAHELRIAQRQAEHARYIEELKVAAAHPELPASTFVTAWAESPNLRVTLDLVDPNSVVDIAQMARDTERLIAGLSNYEAAIGGDGLILTLAEAKRGQVLLTLTPKNATGSAERVKRVADALNAAFDSSTPPTGEVVLDIGRLPSLATAVHAITVA